MPGTGPRIPHLIHQMWIPPAGPAGLPEPLRPCVAGWAALNPGCSHKLWSLAEVLELCARRGRADIAAAIGQCRFPSMQADIARLFLLATFGGFWADLKLRPLRAIPPEWHDCATFLVEHFPTPALPHPAGQLANTFIGAAPGAPVIAQALRLVLRNVAMRQGDGVFGITGPGALTQAWWSCCLEGPARAGAVLVARHEGVWGVAWGVEPDSYNAPGMHWSARQERESPFVAGEAEGPAPGLFVAVPGHRTLIGQIASCQGVRRFEPGPGFAWLAETPPPRLLFSAFMPFDRLRLRVFAPPEMPVALTRFLLNGVVVPAACQADGDGWHGVEIGPFALVPGVNQLAIVPPVWLRRDGEARSLSIAISWIEPWVAPPPLA